MAQELDRIFVPDMLRTAFSVSLGACYKSVEMMRHPQDTATTMFVEMVEIVGGQIRADGLQRKAEALAGAWISKSMDMMETCKIAGEKFTEAK